MSTIRRFRVAPPLARLIRKEREPSGRAIHGYFSGQGDRSHFVSIETGGCYLVMAGLLEDLGGHDRAEVPRSHAEALLDVCAGTVAYERTPLQLEDGREVILNHVMAPETLDLLTVQFADEEDSNGFAPPVWFGADVTDDSRYQWRSIALDGLPALGEVPLSNAVLEALLDTLEKDSEPEPHQQLSPYAGVSCWSGNGGEKGRDRGGRHSADQELNLARSRGNLRQSPSIKDTQSAR